MPIPSYVERTPQKISDYVAREYSVATDAWELMAVKFTRAYKVASSLQESALQKVKARKIARAKADQAAFNFLLSILTVGVAGGVGGALARGIFADTQKNAIDAAKQIGQFAVQQPPAALRDLLDPVKAVRGDIFEPIGPDAFDYYLTLQDNILTQKNLLNIVFEQSPWGDSSLAQSPDVSEKLADWFLDQPYFKDKPDALSIDEKKLAKSMRLALWVAWAYVRDIEYWYWEWRNTKGYYGNPTRERDGDGLLESFDWDPVRLDLVPLGVPEFAITFKSETGAPYHTPIFGFDVWGFCQWAASPEAPRVIFSELPTQRTGFPLSKDRVAQMRLNRNGWFDLANPGVQMWFNMWGH